ncbi:MAG TPA: amino acid adenylation domain-containing protein, partial [Pyrinomonadaceae bacterium]
ELQPQREMSHSPLFQVMLVLQNAPTQDLALSALEVSGIDGGGEAAKFDLTLTLVETHEGISGALGYNTDLFEAETMARMVEHLRVLLVEIVAQPEERIGRLPMLGSVERRQLLEEWNETGREYAAPYLLHELFEQQVERTPEAIALVSGEEQLSYRQLNGRANQLAHRLRDEGVRPEVMVGILMERSVEMVVALLGVLKAGGAYLPLDPAYPVERLHFMLDAARVPVVLTKEHLRINLPANDARIICVDSTGEINSQYSRSNPESEIRADNLAYVIYTSGSTGTPKGVMITHGSVVNLIAALKLTVYAKYESPLCVSVNAPLTFDSSVKQIFQLLAGHTIDIIPEEVRRDGEALLQHIRQHRIQVLDITPSQLRMLIEAGLQESVEPLPAIVLVGGEEIDSTLWQTLSADSARAYYNVYGPTECTVDATACPVEPGREMPSLGRPLSNVEIYVLDSHLQPAAIGVAGELHIGGAGLARGYLNRGELTAEKFIPHPFSEKPGARLYRAGDLVRYRVDGSVEFLGRVDEQVKVRGFRIELGEIESVLGRHAQVRECVVIVREMGGDRMLVAYLVTEGEEPLSVNELRGFAQAQLPAYMVPSAFVMLDEMPLTPNGKVDRKSLSATDKGRSALQQGFVAPRDLLELQLAQVWEEVLGVSPIGVRDDFFENGGHSLLAVRLLARTQQVVGETFALTALFQAPTIERLANLLRRSKRETHWSALVPIQPHGTGTPFFCVHPGGGNVLCYMDLARSLGSGQPFYAFQARGLDGLQTPLTRVEDMAADYLQAMRSVQPDGPYLIGGWSLGGTIAYEMARQLSEQGESIALLALFDTSAPSANLEVAPTDDGTLMLAFAQDLGFSADMAHIDVADFKRLSHDEQIACLWEQAQLANLLTPDMELAQMRNLLRVFEANVRARNAYRESGYNGELTLFRAADGAQHSPQDVSFGWSPWTGREIEVLLTPGSHYTMLKKPHVEKLAERLGERLRQTEN